MTPLREIAATVGVQVDSHELEGLMQVLDGVSEALGQFAVQFSAAFALKGIGEFIKGQIEAADALSDTSDRLGVSTDDLQKFQYQVKLTGGEAEEANHALFFLNRAIGIAAQAGGANPFMPLRIAIKDANGHVKSALDILPELADKVAAAKSPAQQTAIAVDVFGRSALSILPLLRKGRVGVQQLAQEFDELGGGLSKEFVDAGNEAADQLDRLNLVTRSLHSQMVIGLLPAVRSVVGWWIQSSKRNRELIRTSYVLQTGLAFLAGVLAIKLLPTILAGARALVALRTTVLGVSVPVLLLAAIVAATYLAFDDLWTLMRGGKSVIGDLLDKFGGVGAKDKFVDQLRVAWEQIKQAWDVASKALDDLFETMGDGTKGAIPRIGKALVVLIETFGKFVELIGKAATGLKEIKALSDFGIDSAQEAISEELDVWTGNMGSQGPITAADRRAARAQSFADAPAQQAAAAGYTGPARYAPVPGPPQYTISKGGAFAPPGGDVTVNNHTEIRVDASKMTADEAIEATRDARRSGESAALKDTWRALKTGKAGG